MSTSISTNTQAQTQPHTQPQSSAPVQTTSAQPALETLQAVAAATGAAAQLSNIDPQQLMSLLRHLPDVFNKVSTSIPPSGPLVDLPVSLLL